MTRSTPARLYQLRSNSTNSPAAEMLTYRWKYHCVRSRSMARERDDADLARVEEEAIAEIAPPFRPCRGLRTHDEALPCAEAIEQVVQLA